MRHITSLTALDYLVAAIPMPRLTADLLAELSFAAEDLAALRQLGEYRGKQELFARQRPEVFEALRTVAMVESSESSNRLEGIRAPKARIEAIVLRHTRPANRSEQEIAGYRDALNLIHESGRDMPFSANVILQVHRTIYGYLPQRGGGWKMTDNEIVERGPGGEVVRVRFVPVSAVATPPGTWTNSRLATGQLWRRVATIRWW